MTKCVFPSKNRYQVISPRLTEGATPGETSMTDRGTVMAKKARKSAQLRSSEVVVAAGHGAFPCILLSGAGKTDLRHLP